MEILTRQNYAGLGDLNGIRPDVNETRKDVKIEAGKTYLLWARMSYTADQIHVIAKLDDETVINWEGRRAEVDDPYYATPKPASLGLAVSGDASTFHSLELRMIDGELKDWRPAK